MWVRSQLNSVIVKRAGILLGFIFTFLGIQYVEASHLRAGQITVIRRDCISREVTIIVRVYTNTGSPVVFGGDGILSFGDGTSVIVPEIPNTLRPDLGPNIGVAEYRTTHTFSGVGRFTISYVEPNRNGGVLNMDNSFYTTFYLETQIDLAIPNCNFPILEIDPIDQACTGVAFFHNPGAVDRDGADSLSYELAIPFRDRGLPVVNYRDPASMSFVNETGGSPTFTIDPINGTLVWDSPGVPGEYNVAFHVNEWKKINGIWTKIGYVRRDMQIIVNDDCNNQRPILFIPDDVCVEAGTTITETISGMDPDNHPVKIQATSEVFSLAVSPATRTPVLPDGDTGFQPSPASITFNWNTVCAHVKGQPYQVNFKITDRPTPGVKLATFATWQITVVAPAPVLQTATPVLPQRHVTLNWAPYDCALNASAIQIWRKVDVSSYTPANCETGMPESLGFTLVGTTSASATSFTDTNNGRRLEPGAKYCYRLVAVFAEEGAESYVSNEVCIDPIKTSAPIITKVTVDQTSENDGEITVDWIDPLETLDPVQYPLPYNYELQRQSNSGFVTVHTGYLNTNTYTETGLNTKNQQYAYRVKLYDADGDFIDSSSVASSVWLDLTTAKQQITLDWSANVPWSNQVQAYVHDIYSGPDGATTLADLTLLTSVNVSGGMTYVHGNPPAVPLDSTQVYCYAVVTRGSYGNTEIAEPLENVSQINCARPVSTRPPCMPVVTAMADPCERYFEEYTCSSSIFKNRITWSAASATCESEVRWYNVYRATSENGIYTRIATGVRDTFFVDDNLPTPARCYRISAVDRSNNESELSDPICIETCPYYELPNFFSPNGDKCNDYFSAYGVDLELEETSNCRPDMTDPAYTGKCARFVEKVVFKVYNRWGGKLYEYTGRQNSEESIYIKWDGRDKSGKELATGIYYYTAEVTFETIDPAKRNQLIKGWVQLVR